MADNCKGRVINATIAKRKDVETKWFDPTDKNEKADAIEELVSHMSVGDGFGNVCEPSDCEKKETEWCRPTKVTFELLEGSSDLGLATVNLFGKKLEKYIFKVKEEGRAKLKFTCECMPKQAF